MFISKSYVYVVRDDKEITQNEKVQEQLDSIIGNNILILLLVTLDKRTKFYKAYKDTIVEFEALKPAILKKYIQKEIDLSDKNTEKLMEVCEYDYGRCLLEIDKIRKYISGPRPDGTCMDYDTSFIQLLADGTIYQPPKDAIFDFVDAILDNKVNLSFELYHQCLGVGEAVMVMITVLYNNAKAVLQVQSCKSSDIGKSTGLTGWQIKNAQKHLRKRTNGDLIYIMERCQKSQQAIVTGVVDEEFIMEDLLTRIL
jgi:DNA polymerase III delta subunit